MFGFWSLAALLFGFAIIPSSTYGLRQHQYPTKLLGRGARYQFNLKPKMPLPSVS